MNLELKKFEQLKAAGELPSPKGVALTIIRLTQQDNVSTAQLEHAIKSDPAFVGRLLKAANAAGRHSGRPIVAISGAIRVLGLGVVRNLALSFSLVSGYRQGKCAGFDFDRFWNRSLLTGLAFQEIARKVGGIAPEEAFCCGLLADVGQLALATVHPEAYGQLLADLGEQPDLAALREREASQFVLAHDDLSAAMLADWGLPHHLIEALYYRARPLECAFTAGSRSELLLRSALLADRVADVCLLDDERRGGRVATLDDAAALVDLSPDTLSAVVDGVSQQWQEWGKLLAIRTQVLPDYARMLSDNVAEAAGGGNAIRVLVALGAARDRKQVETLLQRLSYRTFVVDNGDAALETALDVHPQVLIVDAALTGIDGVGLIRALRATKLGRSAYMLLLTGEQDEDRLVEAYEAGADDYLIKPLKERVLAARLRAGVRVAELQLEVERDHREMKQFAAELAVTNRRLHEASITDPLTGCYNRRYAMERLEQEWAASNRSGKPLSCMMIDLDRFKEVNDRFGHDLGDQLLVAAASALRENLRANDVICRMGGDEFLVISPEADAAAIRVAAARLLAAVDAVLVAGPAGEVRCGVSIGIATRQADTATLAMLMKAADEGMYQAKIGGRHRIAVSLD